MNRIDLKDEDMIGMDEPQYSGWVMKLSENMAEAEIKFKQILEDLNTINKVREYVENYDGDQPDFYVILQLKEFLKEKS